MTRLEDAFSTKPREQPIRRILTIDGGGIKGVFPASFLASLEDRLGESISSYFDLIAGTSTGGIIAIGLGLGMTSHEILRLYCENAGRIFPRSRGLGVRRVFRAKYAKTALRHVLTEVLGDRLLGESLIRLVIPSLNLATEKVHVYKTPHAIDLINDYKVPAVEVALATVAAPSYFPIHLSPEGVPFIDGGVWARNPVGVAVIEAIGILGWARDSIRVLSLGCTSTRLNVEWQKRTSLGSSYWGARLADVFLTAQCSSAMVTAQTLIGSENVFRISPDTSDRRFTLDGVEHLPALRDLGMHEASRTYSTLAPVFFQHKAEAFVPYHFASLERPTLLPSKSAAA